MSRWTDLATWRGPTVNQRTGHIECRGLVVHIASGFYEGTISWEKNPDAAVSSHFVVGRDGAIAQVVDTNDTAWTQRAGNGHWLSVECEGFAPEDPLHASHPGWESLTPAQIEAVARLFERGHREWGYPLEMATSPAGRGLGHHSMGAENGVQWGHSRCPGEAIKAQKPTILARSLQLAGITTQEDDMDVLERLDQVVSLLADGRDAGGYVGAAGYAGGANGYTNSVGGGNNFSGIRKDIGALAERVNQIGDPAGITQDALNAAVKAAFSDPDVVAGIAKAVNDDAAKRLVE